MVVPTRIGRIRHSLVGGGARLIRPVIVAICLIMLARYVWQRGLLVF
jgi:hypothetical protein